MFYIYVLQNSHGGIYVGYTADLKTRLKVHNAGGSKYTKNFRPWKLAYYEAYQSSQDAKTREKTLKKYGSTLGQLKKRISNSLESKDQE